MIYFIISREQNAVKVGYAKNPFSRFHSLQTGNPDDLDLDFFIEGGTKKEKEIHKELDYYRIRGEWFLLKDNALFIVNKYRQQADKDNVFTSSACCCEGTRIIPDSNGGGKLCPFCNPGFSAERLKKDRAFAYSLWK